MLNLREPKLELSTALELMYNLDLKLGDAS
jgi:hypothetical protein